MAESYTRQIPDDRDYIQEKLASRGDILLSRWKKRSLAQRRNALLRAKPNTYEGATPQWDLTHRVVNIASDFWILQREHRDVWLLPWLTVENLCADKVRLLALLNYRVHFGLQDWALFDLHQHTFAYTKGYLDLRFNKLCVRIRGEGYGTLEPWSKAAAHAYDVLSWPRAQLVLEAQAKLFAFLRNMVDVLLEGSANASGCENMVNALATHLAAPDRRWCAIISQPFSLPRSSRLAETWQVAMSKTEQCWDEVDLLQTQPEYTLARIEQLEKTYVTGTQFEKDPEEAWEVIAYFLAQDRVLVVPLWSILSHKLSTISRPKELGDTAPAADPKPAEESFEESVSVAMDCTLLVLRVYRQEIADLLAKIDGQLKKQAKSQAADEATAIAEACRDLAEKNDHPLRSALANLCRVPLRTYGWEEDEVWYGTIESYLSTVDPSQQAKLDPSICELLGDFAAALWILRALKCIQVESSCVTEDPSLHAQTLESMRELEPEAPEDGDMSKWSASAVNSYCGAALAAFAKEKWPKGKKDFKWLEHATRSRQALNRFWQTYRAQFQGSPPWVSPSIESILDAARSPEHEEELRKEREAIAAAEATRAARKNETFVTPEWYTGGQEVPLAGRKLVTEASKPSKKRDHEDTAEDFSSEETAQNHEEDVSASKAGPIAVNPASLRLFKGMFNSDMTGEYTTGEFKWQQLLAAMVRASTTVPRDKSRSDSSIPGSLPEPIDPEGHLSYGGSIDP
jgi:hypothetical protein